MSMLKQEIITENSRWMTDCQALIEGTLKLPEGLEEISGILEIAGLAELGEIRAGEGRIDLDGTAGSASYIWIKKGRLAASIRNAAWPTAWKKRASRRICRCWGRSAWGM